MKIYTLQFGSGDPRLLTGLVPVFDFFQDLVTGATLSGPAISETYVGSGIYKFSWGTTNPISFLADAATTSPGTAGRYIAGQLDPADRADEYGNTLVALGISNLALGNTILSFASVQGAIGTTASSSGDISTNPSTLFGYMIRISELIQGQQVFTKVSGQLNMFDRTGTTLFVTRTVTNSSSLVIKA